MFNLKGFQNGLQIPTFIDTIKTKFLLRPFCIYIIFHAANSAKRTLQYFPKHSSNEKLNLSQIVPGQTENKEFDFLLLSMYGIAIIDTPKTFNRKGNK